MYVIFCRETKRSIFTWLLDSNLTSFLFLILIIWTANFVYYYKEFANLPRSSSFLLAKLHKPIQKKQDCGVIYHIFDVREQISSIR